MWSTKHFQGLCDLWATLAGPQHHSVLLLLCVLSVCWCYSWWGSSVFSGVQGMDCWEGRAVNWIMVSSPFCASCWRCTKMLRRYSPGTDSNEYPRARRLLCCSTPPTRFPCPVNILLFCILPLLLQTCALMPWEEWYTTSGNAALPKWSTRLSGKCWIVCPQQFWALCFNALWQRILLS